MKRPLCRCGADAEMLCNTIDYSSIEWMCRGCFEEGQRKLMLSGLDNAFTYDTDKEVNDE